MVPAFARGEADAGFALIDEAMAAALAGERSTLDTVVYLAPSVDAFVTTEVDSTPLVQRMSEEIFRRIRADAHDVLAPFTTADGRVEAPFESNLVVARRS